MADSRGVSENSGETVARPSWPAEWPASVRRIASATDDALAAVAKRDRTEFEDAIAQFDRADAPQASAVHSEMVRMLLEEVHPDGLTGENLQEVLGRTVRSAQWLPDLDIDGFVDVLTGALGVHESGVHESGGYEGGGYEGGVHEGGDHAGGEQPRARPRPAHALLLVADVLAVRQARAEVYLRRAIAEIRRAQTIEMP